MINGVLADLGISSARLLNLVTCREIQCAPAYFVNFAPDKLQLGICQPVLLCVEDMSASMSR